MAESKLRTLSIDFAVQILNLVKFLKSQHETIVSNQIGRTRLCRSFLLQYLQHVLILRFCAFLIIRVMGEEGIKIPSGILFISGFNTPMLASFLLLIFASGSHGEPCEVERNAPSLAAGIA